MVHPRIAPGATIGILGGGQLGRMLAMAAAQIGYRVHIFAPETDSIAAEVAAQHTCAAWDDEDALRAFAGVCDVVTFEWENVPVAAARVVAETAPLCPGISSLEVAQDRLAEKTFVVAHGGRTARFAPADHGDMVDAALAAVGVPALLKTRRLGYDGKGQVRIDSADGGAAGWDRLGGAAAIAEGFVDFFAEFSVILVRDGEGHIAFWDSPVNVHDGGILAQSTLPVPDAVAAQVADARALSATLARALDHIGVLTVEFFATRDGPLVNEIAPRVHNSGHWTIEGAVTSQFENHIRAIAGQPLGDPATRALPVTMRNLIGDAAHDWPALLSDPDCRLHLYGKGTAVPGRKMGHVTWAGTTPIQAEEIQAEEAPVA